jgi:imidazolonepropionase-like amidohydrolase
MLLTLLPYALHVGCASAATHEVRIAHVTLVSPERSTALEDASVIIRDDRIAQIAAGPAPGVSLPASAKVDTIDARGLFLSPGLIDSHVHIADFAGFAIPGMSDEQEKAHPEIARAARAQIPRSYLYFGFTTLIDLVSTPQLRERWASHSVRPDTYFCGGAAVMDGYPMHMLAKPERYRFFPYFIIEPANGSPPPPGIDPTQHTPQAVVARMRQDGAICVKTFFERGFGGDHDLPVPRVETLQALVRAAHEAGLPVLIHASSTEAQQFALAAGVDIIAHGLWNWSEPQEGNTLPAGVRTALDGVIAGHVGWQPTVQVLYGLRDLFDPAFLSDPRVERALPRELIAWYRTPEAQWFRAQIERGTNNGSPLGSEANARFAREIFARIIARDESAVGYLSQRGARILFGTDTPSAPTYANPPGLNGRLEMQRLVDAGMTPAQILHAATAANAEALKLHDVGTVQVGKRANLLLLRENPQTTIQAYDEIVKVILGGQVIDRAALAAGPVKVDQTR